jgi:hypothetical protein
VISTTQQNYNSKMSIDELRLQGEDKCIVKLSIIRECLGGLWSYTISAINREDIKCLDYIFKTAVTTLVQDIKAIEGEESIVLAKEVLDLVQYVEMAMASIQLKVDTKHVLERAREASYDQETDEFQRDVDMFIDGLDSDSD